MFFQPFEKSLLVIIVDVEPSQAGQGQQTHGN